MEEDPSGIKYVYSFFSNMAGLFAIDESVLALEELYFSGGKVGVQVKVKVDDFLNLAHPKIADLVK